MLKTIFKLLGSLAILIALFVFMDTEAIFARLRDADVHWLGFALIVLTVLTFLMARRWQLTACSFGFDLPYRRAVREYYIAQFLNLVLPSGMAGDAARALRLKKDRPLKQAAQTVFMERLIGQTTLFLMMFVGFTFALLVPGGVPWPNWSWAWLAIMACVAFVVVACAGHKSAVGAFLRKAIWLMTRPEQVLLSAAIAVLISVAFYFCASATGTDLPVTTLFTMIPLLLTAMLIPLSVGGWGWREGAAAALFPLAGATPSAGVAAGIAYGAMMLIAALPAVFFLVFAQNGATSDVAD